MTNKKNKLIIGIKRTIKEYLDIFCDDKSTPYLCKLKETRKGRRKNPQTTKGGPQVAIGND